MRTIFQIIIALTLAQQCLCTEKEWTVLVYMSAVNNLLPFADRNLEQMKRVGSNELVNIIVHLDTHRPHCEKSTKRLLVHKNRIEQIGPDRCMDSGDEKTLIDALVFAETEFPARNLAVVIWDHGIGPINDSLQSLESSKMYTYNRATRSLDLSRDIFQHHLFAAFEHKLNRAICFDDTTNNYLTEQKFRTALDHFCINHRNGKKIDVVCFDACLMSTLEVALNIAPYAHYMTASQEVVPGPGLNYEQVLLPLTERSMTPKELAQHIVASYKTTYEKITQDFTQSALDLAYIEETVEALNEFSEILIHQLKNGVLKKNYIEKARNGKKCTHFFEPSYIDLVHFLNNVIQEAGENKESARLKDIAKKTIELIKKTIIANACGRHLPKACGISIYFPETPPLHHSYYDIHFSKTNSWLSFLVNYHTLN